MKSYQLPFWIAIMSFMFILYGTGVLVEKKINQMTLETQKLQQSYSLLRTSMSYMENIKRMEMEATLEWPVLFEDFTYLTSPFGIRDIPKQLYTGGSITRDHSGTDFAGTFQARIVAVADGIVMDKYFPPDEELGHKGHPVLGGMIKIKHTDGTYSVYGHLSETYVTERGATSIIKAGQVIGRMGNTGVSTGQHLHFELHDINDKQIQPLLYLKDPRNINN